MAYESGRFKEHHEVRLPLLRELLRKGWSRDRIICPSPDSDDREWRVPKSPSENALREAGRSFNGYPVDMAILILPSIAASGIVFSHWLKRKRRTTRKAYRSYRRI